MLGSKLAGVLRVMSFGISSSLSPTASFAAILAIGNPVAFEASAELRDTRGFISITSIRPVSGSTENWTVGSPGIDSDLAEAGQRTRRASIGTPGR